MLRSRTIAKTVALGRLVTPLNLFRFVVKDGVTSIDVDNTEQLIETLKHELMFGQFAVRINQNKYKKTEDSLPRFIGLVLATEMYEISTNSKVSESVNLGSIYPFNSAEAILLNYKYVVVKLGSQIFDKYKPHMRLPYISFEIATPTDIEEFMRGDDSSEEST